MTLKERALLERHGFRGNVEYWIDLVCEVAGISIKGWLKHLQGSTVKRQRQMIARLLELAEVPVPADGGPTIDSFVTRKRK